MWALKVERRRQLIEVFDHLHNHPEVSWQEYATRDYLLACLEQVGCRIRTFSDCPGIVADWGEGEPRVGLRGDMDALWQQVDGVFCANHSCGHDAHMTMALGALFNFIDHGCSGALRLVLQPAEEKGEGALKMVEHRAMEGLTHFYGLHLRPIQELRMGKCAGAILHGACGSAMAKIISDDAHAGRPHLGVNAIEVGAALVNALACLHLDPMVPYSVKMTRFHAGGSATNIIPGYAEFSIDFRAQTNAQMRALTKATQKLIQDVATTFGTSIELDLHLGTPASEVHPQACAIMAEAIVGVLGEAQLEAPVVTAGGDDFHYYTVKNPELIATMLALGCDLEPGLHHPKMTFQRDAMFTGVQILTAAIALSNR